MKDWMNPIDGAPVSPVLLQRTGRSRPYRRHLVLTPFVGGVVVGLAVVLGVLSLALLLTVYLYGVL